MCQFIYITHACGHSSQNIGSGPCGSCCDATINTIKSKFPCNSCTLIARRPSTKPRLIDICPRGVPADVGPGGLPSLKRTASGSVIRDTSSGAVIADTPPPSPASIKPTFHDMVTEPKPRTPRNFSRRWSLPEWKHEGANTLKRSNAARIRHVKSRPVLNFSRPAVIDREHCSVQ